MRNHKGLKRIERKAILVGGAVRDFLLKFVANDLDYIILDETINSMLLAGFRQVGKDFPVFLHPVTNDEYALARVERKTGKGHTAFTVVINGVTFEEDAYRRDLTINAMGMKKDGTILDPFNGQEDLKNKILRHVSEAFAEDPLRVLRVARFAAKLPDFTIHPTTIELCKSLRDEMETLTPERVFKEFEKALNSKMPSKYFRALLEMNVLDIIHPEIFAMVGKEQRVDYHSEGDVFEHTMRVLDEVCKITDCIFSRYAALYHDIGKPDTDKGTGSYLKHESPDVVKPLFEELKKRKHPNKFIKIGLKVAVHHTFVHGFPVIGAKSILKRMMEKDLPNFKEIENKNEKKEKKIIVDFPSNDEELNILLNVALADERGRILGTRKLSFDEVEAMYNGKSIDSFSFRENIDHYNTIRLVHKESKRKIEIPDDILESKNVYKIKEHIYLERLKLVKKVIKKNK